MASSRGFILLAAQPVPCLPMLDCGLPHTWIFPADLQSSYPSSGIIKS